MSKNQPNIASLRTVSNYAIREKVSTSYIYKLIRDKKMESVTIDGVQFIDVEAYPVLPTAKQK